MAGLPEVTITGTVVADPELKYFDSGACVVNFTVAANDRRFDRERGEWVDASATFLRCSAWRQMAENISESLSKGHRVMVTGVLRQRSFQTESGEKRHLYEVDVAEVGVSLKFATATVNKAQRNGAYASTGSPTNAADEPPF